MAKKPYHDPLGYLLSLTEAASVLRIPYARVLQLATKGIVHAHRVGRAWRITREALADAVALQGALTPVGIVSAAAAPEDLVERLVAAYTGVPCECGHLGEDHVRLIDGCNYLGGSADWVCKCPRYTIPAARRRPGSEDAQTLAAIDMALGEG